MATIGTSRINLLDLLKRTKPDGSVETNIAELLAQTSSIIADAPVLPSNEKMGHRETLRTALPTVQARRFNKGVDTSKSETAQIVDPIALYAGRGQVDSQLLKINGNSMAVRFTEDKAHIEAMAQALARDLIYGNNALNPDQITGLAVRYGSKSNANLAKYIIDAGGTTGRLTSIYLIGWDTDKVNLRYPQNDAELAGISTQDLGEKEVYDDDGKPYMGYVSYYNASLGLSIKDYRYVVRICNIPIDSVSEDGSAVDLWNLLTRAYNRLHSLTNCQPRFYANRELREALDIQKQNKKNVELTPVTIDGVHYPVAFRGIPLQMEEAILSTEERVI